LLGGILQCHQLAARGEITVNTFNAAIALTKYAVSVSRVITNLTPTQAFLTLKGALPCPALMTLIVVGIRAPFFRIYRAIYV